MSFLLLCNTPFWDSGITWFTDNPNFSRCFQSTVLSWIPVGIILLCLPFEIFRKRKNLFEISWNAYNISMSVVTLFILLLKLVIFISLVETYYDSKNTTVTLSDVLAPILLSLSLALAFAFKINQQKNGVVSHTGLFLFWFSVFLGDLVKFRSAILDVVLENAPVPTNILRLGFTFATFPLTAFVFLLLFIPDTPSSYGAKLSSLNVRERRQLSSLPAIITNAWILKYVYKGYSETLSFESLWTLPKNELADSVYQMFMKKWNYYRYSKKDEHVSTTKVVFAIYWLEYLLVYFLRFFTDIIQFLNPIFLQMMIKFLEGDSPMWQGILISAILPIPMIMRIVFMSNFFLIAKNMGIKLRTMLTIAIFKKSLQLSNVSRKNFSIGEMVNLMAVDSQKFIEMLMFFPQFINSFITFVLVTYMLWQILGPSCLSGVVVVLILMPLNGFSATVIKKYQRHTMIFSDKRLNLVNEMLNGMKVLKLYAWELPFSEEIQRIRSQEIQTLTKNAYFMSLVSSLWNSTAILMTIASFVTYINVDETHVLDASTAFVSLTLFNIMRIPLNTLPRAISTFIEVLVSVKRLDKFLNSSELDTEAVQMLNCHNETALEVENASFTWGESSSEPDLTNINLNIKSGSLVAIVGRVGSGKTSLLSAVLGDMNFLSGTVHREKSVAYVPQQAWIQNASVKENITFFKSYSPRTYQAVVEACALLPDFELFVAGDATEIGEKGVNLSGGQKQRISLARAVYNDAELFVLDDPLSAVDAHVGKHIFDEVIGPNGLLREKTRLFATNNLGFLSQCDQIIVLKEGEISEFGTYKRLLANNGTFSELILQHLSENNERLDEELEIIDEMLAGASLSEELRSELFRSRSIPSEAESVESNSSEKSRKLRQRKKSNLKKQQKGCLIEVEGMETGKVKIEVYTKYMREMGLILTVFCVFAWLLFIAFVISSNIWLKTWTDDASTPELIEDRSFVQYRYTIFMVLSLLQVASLFCGLFTMSRGVLVASKRLHNSMLQCVIRSPMSFFDTTPIGRIMNRFSKDCNVMDVTLLQCLMMFLPFSTNLIASIIIIVSQTPIILIIFIPLMFLFMFIQKMYLQCSRQIKRIESVTRSPIYSFFSECSSGASSIRAYGVDDIVSEEFRTRANTNHIAFFSTFLVVSWLEICVSYLSGTVVVGTGILSVLFKDIIGPSAAGLAITYGYNLTGMLLFFIQGTTDIETNIVSGERIMEYTKISSEADWEIEDSEPNDEWPEEGAVEFEGYQTKYRPELDLVLKGIDCTINPSEKIGICGRTGAGKSSLTLSLFRIIEATQGKIKIDGKDISKLGLYNLRSKLTIIPQDPVLFTGTLRFNLDPFNKYTDCEVWKALELSHLKDFISKMNEGLQSPVAEGGSNFSVGQRQLFCLSRALLRKTKVLLLDEATAAVDLETDELIQATLRKEFVDCTVITIAHRLNTIMDSSRIMVLSDGFIIEFDSPQNLLKDEKSAFYGMVQDSAL